MNKSDHPEPNIFVIFGGTGDLSWRKLMPALFDLSQDQNLPKQYAIIVVGRKAISIEQLISHLHQGVKKFSRQEQIKPADWKEFADHITYFKGDYEKSQTYTSLGKECEKLEKEWKVKARHIFYMATPPSMFGVIPKFISEAGLNKDRENVQIVVEKPIGYDLDSARKLNTELAENYDESQIFRIDHYLGKETVQNILAFRFANPIFEPIWNRHYIEYVTITAAESVGVEDRGGYYDHAGALRDMVQNHLLQLLCLVAMEPMVSFEADEIRNKKVDILHSIPPITKEQVPHSVVRGQYGPGKIDGKKVVGYREEEGVAPDSQTETFVALKVLVDNWRWQGVPFYLRTGKCLGDHLSEIQIQFRSVPHQSFPAESTLNWQSSRLIIAIQPKEGITLKIQAKNPGPKMHLRTVDMAFNYQDTFKTKSPEAYETLLWDIINKDATLFMRADQVEAAWQIVMPILDLWSAADFGDFPNYAAGTWGPEDANKILAQGQTWS